MFDRRQLLGALALPALAPSIVARPTQLFATLARAEAASSEEDFWAEIGRGFTIDRSLTNLNNGGVSPSPAFVQEAMKRHLDFSNNAPPYSMWRILEPQREVVRERLAMHAGVDMEEIAITRNASEGLQICQFGMDFEPGDEVLTTNQDYPRMITTFRQMERRRGIVLKQFSIPVPAEDPAEIVRLFEENITPKTRVILMCHVIFMTGQVLPVKEVVAMARRHGIPVIIDGAHAFAHLPFRLADLDCDFYATSLHKWLFAPHGTGLLYVRSEKISDVWPMMGADPEFDEDIRKFEQIGTHPAANCLAIAEALTFNQGIGFERKYERLCALRDYWAKPMLEHDRVRFHTSLRPGLAGAIATFEVDGIDPGELASHLWREHRILVTSIAHDEFQGVRVSPSVYTTHEELDRFIDAVGDVIRR